MALPPIVGSYQPLLELASGGMASVYAVRQVGAQGFERVVVMKRVHPHLVDNREFREMFLDEAHLSSLIRHPNIVPVIDVAEGNGELFLIMEYVESISLAQLLRSLADERLPPSLVSRIVCDVLSGLHAAHEAVDLRGNAMNIIHRDVSPQNIIVGVDGTSRLIDFGIAKASSRLTPTTAGMLKGKFGYMAPEQIRQQALDRRVDVFAAGVVLHEALTSRRLFAAGDEADAVLGVLVREVPGPSTIAPRIPKELDAVVHRALARDRDERFATAADMAEAIEAVCPTASPREIATLVARVGEGTLRARRQRLQAAFERPAEAAVAPSPTPVEVPIEWPDSSRGGGRRLPMLGLGAAVAAMALGIFVWSGRSASRNAESTSTEPAPASSSSTAPSTASTQAPEPAPSSEPPASPPTAASAGPATSYGTISSAAPRATAPPKPAARPQRPKSDIHKNNPYLVP